MPSRLRDIWARRRELRFVAVGMWNTAFAYGVFALLYRCFGGGWRDVPVQVVAAIAGISNAYLCHRAITFRAHGVWWREYARFYVVYGGQALLQMALFFIFSTWLGMNGYVVQFLLAILLTVLSYWAHSNYSFKDDGSDRPQNTRRADDSSNPAATMPQTAGSTRHL